jgi:hypothetical protein
MVIGEIGTCPFKNSHKHKKIDDSLYVVTHSRCSSCKEIEPCVKSRYLEMNPDKTDNDFATYKVYVNKAEPIEQAPNPEQEPQAEEKVEAPVEV